MNEKHLTTPIKSESLVQTVINRITDAIISGELKPGDKLPTEVELMATLQVSRNTVREAIRTLIAYGVVEIRRPEGTFVCNNSSPNMLSPLLYQTILAGGGSHEYILELRQIVDVGITQLIRERGLSEADREELEHLNNEYEYELRSENYSVQRVLDKDIEFHKAVAAATHNPFIAMLHDFVADVTTESRYRTIAKVFEENDREYLIKTHRLTLDALEKKPGVDVNEVIEFSYFYWKDSYNW